MKKRLKNTLLLLTAAGLFGCTGAPLGKVTPQQEMSMGAQQERQVLSKVRTVRQGRLYRAVVNVGSRIARVSGRRDFQWRYHLVDNPNVANAFVLPGGKVFVYTGLFKYAANEDELAVVVAHEVAHALRSHGVKGAQRQQKAGLIGALLQVGMGVAGVKRDTAQTVTQVYRQGATLGYLRPHSREQELEADSIGLMLMAKAGYDPRAALRFWSKFGKAGQRIPEYLSTHPNPGHRIANLKRLMPKALEIYRRSPYRRR
jgi:predicted Zn-dependent protease